MSEHPIKSLMSTTMENLKDMIDVNTIIGDPVETPDGSVILTVSKVGFGFASGGSEFSADGGSGGKSEGQSSHPFGGGAGGGVSITPIAFLIVNAQGVRMLHLDQNTHLIEKVLDSAPAAVEKIQQLFSKNQNQDGGGSQNDNESKQNNSSHSNGQQNNQNSGHDFNI